MDAASESARDLTLPCVPTLVERFALTCYRRAMSRWSCGLWLLVVGACGDDTTRSVTRVDAADTADVSVLIPYDTSADSTADALDTSSWDTPISDECLERDTFVASDTVEVDSAVVDTLVAPDTFVEDTFVEDTFVEDTFVAPDTFVEDTLVEPDTFVEDTFVEDTFVEDTFVADTATPDDNTPGVLIYQKVPNILAVDDLVRVKWHPSGDYALIFGRKNEVFRYDAATRTIASAGKLGASTATLSDVEVAPEGFFLIVGVDGGKSTVWRVTLDDTDKLVVDATILPPTGTAVAITYEPHSSPSRFGIIASSTNNNISYFYLYGSDSGLGNVLGFNTSAGPFDLMWADPTLTAGSPALVTSEGVNGGGSHTWVLQSNLVVGNGWSGGFGNGGRAAWRPSSTKTGGGYGVVCGWSSNKLYVYDGQWTLGTLPVPTGAGPQAVAWRDHRRALVVGRVIGTSPYATVVEIRAGETTSWSGATLVDQSIPGFAQAPWFGNTSAMYLQDVDWRPGVACDEGLMVGSDNGTQFSPTFGTIARFYDSSDPACTP